MSLGILQVKSSKSEWREKISKGYTTHLFLF